MKQKVAILDVDGTLFNGNLGIDLLKLLISSHVFSQEIGDQIFLWYGKYKSGEVEKGIVVDEIYRLYAIGVTGLGVDIINQKASETWNAVQHNLFKFTPEMIKKLTESGYKIILLSGSPIEMVFEIGSFLGISQDDLLGGQLEIVDNKYTGKIISYPGDSAQKVSILNEHLDRAGIEVDWSESIAVGDNEREADIFSLVGHPFVINPSESMIKLASRYNWKVVNQDNVLEAVFPH